MELIDIQCFMYDFKNSSILSTWCALADNDKQYGFKCDIDSKCTVLYIGCGAVQVSGIKIDY